MNLSKIQEISLENVGPEVSRELNRIEQIVSNRASQGHFNSEAVVDESLLDRVRTHLEFDGFKTQTLKFELNGLTHILIDWSK